MARGGSIQPHFAVKCQGTLGCVDCSTELGQQCGHGCCFTPADAGRMFLKGYIACSAPAACRYHVEGCMHRRNLDTWIPCYLRTMHAVLAFQDGGKHLVFWPAYPQEVSVSLSKPRVYGLPLHTSTSVVQQQRSHQEYSSYTERTRGGSVSVFRCVPSVLHGPASMMPCKRRPQLCIECPVFSAMEPTGGMLALLFDVAASVAHTCLFFDTEPVVSRATALSSLLGKSGLQHDVSPVLAGYKNSTGGQTLTITLTSKLSSVLCWQR